MPRPFPVDIKVVVDLDTVQTVRDLDVVASGFASLARDAIFRALIAPPPIPTEPDKAGTTTTEAPAS